MDDKDFLCPVCRCAPLITDYCPSCSRIESAAPSSEEVREMVERLREMATGFEKPWQSYESKAADLIERLAARVPDGCIATLEQQNAELVAALQMLADLHDASGMPQSAIRMNAAKAIAKVKQP